jgi:hypothetical protein
MFWGFVLFVLAVIFWLIFFKIWMDSTEPGENVSLSVIFATADLQKLPPQAKNFSALATHTAKEKAACGTRQKRRIRRVGKKPLPRV